MPAPEPQREHGISEVVPVDNEPYVALLQREPRDGKRRKRRRILDQDEIRTDQRPQLSPQAIAESQVIENRDDGITDGRRFAKPAVRWRQAMNLDLRVLGDRPRQ